MTVQPVTTTQNLTADRSWLASLHGTGDIDTVTLDLSTFIAGTHYVASTDTAVPYSRLMSGLLIGKITANGLYGLYSPGAADGRQDLAGFVFAEVLFNPAASKIPAALLWHGSVKTAKLPVVVAPVAPSAICQIRFVYGPPTMTVQDLIKDVTTADLTTFARYIPTPADFLLTQTVFAKVSIQDVMWRIKNTGRYVNAAKYRSFDASVPFSDRQAWQTSTQGMLPALGQKLLVGEMELILQEVSRGADQDRLLQLLYDDVERHVEAINSPGAGAGDVLADGKFSLVAENGLTLDVDFGVPAANMPVAPKSWSDPTSDPIADELGWIAYLDSISAPMPEMVITSRRVYAYLAGNNAYRAAYYGSVNPSNTPTATLTPQQVNVVRDNYGLPPITLYRAQVRVDGVATKCLPDDRWIMLPPDRPKWGQTLYGTTAESLALSRGSNPAITREDAPGLIITRGAQDDPVQIWTKGAAVAMPVLYAPDCHITAKVL